MSLYRLIFFIYFKPSLDFDRYFFDIVQSFILGFRFDLTVVGYVFIINYFISLIFYILNYKNYNILKYIYFLFFLIILFLMGSDFGFYTYFKEHLNILFFGLFDDDTKALMVTFWQNYPVVLIFIVFAVFSYLGFFVIDKIFSLNIDLKENIFTKYIYLTLPLTAVFIFIITRGSFGMYPLGKMLPNISDNTFINQTAQNSVRSFLKAYKIRRKYFSKKYDLIKECGFKGKIEEAFKIHTFKSNLDKDLLKNITYKTPKNIKDGLNVVVIMVESFGKPILKYNSEDFDLLRSMKKHFENDILFDNFISSGDGTINSLESLLLNITYRPGSFPLSQSNYKKVSFKYSPAFLYKDKGYETTFIYGGELTWRDIGEFVKNQGYDFVEGKINIYKSIKNSSGDKEYFHPWGIYDEFLFEHIEKKLLNSKKPQFIFALTTNNHPPYTIPKGYKSKELKFSKELLKHLHGDIDLIKKRFYSYQYAIDQVGKFLDFISQNPTLKKNTIVAVTADNNTIDAILSYDKNQLLNSKNIPLLLYIPKELKRDLKVNTTVFGSHKDIFPTLYNLTLSNTNYIAIGTNLFDMSKKHIGFNGSMVIASKDGIVKLKSLNKKESGFLANYYKATLAVEEFLLRSYKK